MRKSRFLILALVVAAVSLVLSTTSFFHDISKTKELILFEDTGVREAAPVWAIMEMARKDAIPSEWSLFADEHSILEATNGLIGPLKNDPFRAGALRYNLQLVIKKQKVGATPALFISPDGMTAKFLAVFAFDDQVYCDLTTLRFNDNKIWPRYLEEDQKYYNVVFR